MADAIITVVVTKLLDLLQKQAREEVDLLTGIEEKVRNLSITLERIQAVLDDAEQRKIKEKTVEAWLQDLEEISYEIDDLLDDWGYLLLKEQIEGTFSNGHRNRDRRIRSVAPSCFSCFKQAVVHRDIALKVKEVSGRLDLIEKRKNQFGFNITSSGIVCNSQEWRRVQSCSFVDTSEVFGRVSEKDILVSQLLSCQEGKDATQMLSIVGTGGIGKTTLAQLAYNDDQVKDYFYKRGWVCVSDPFDEIKVAKAILESFQGCSPNLNELDSLLQGIKDVTFGKRFLLVLDDVWSDNPMKWEPLRNSMKYGAPGSTILLTTRSEKVATVAGAIGMMHLGVLSDSESWSLFHQIALSGRSMIECERIENIGREIARKCKGLPLAIKTIGGLLRFKNSIEEWQKVVYSNMWELDIAEVELFPHLYLSYNDLPVPVRSCFSYCAIFSKDKVIEVDDLIRIWMAQGYLNSRGSDQNEMEMKGKDYFENLAARSFFQDFTKDEDDGRIVSCKMHDIVHDFAQFIRKKECSIINGTSDVTVYKNARHVTWFGNGEASNILSGYNIGQPRTFLAQYLNLETVTADLLKSLKFVRVLKLHRCGLKELPEEIGDLIHLRYMDLSYNELKELPKTVYDLYNLQTLILHGCSGIRELPQGIEKLKNLRSLIHIVENMKYPIGIKELTCLQTLSEFSVGREYNKLGYLKNLNLLRGSLDINIMDKLDDVTDAQDANLKSKKHIRRLAIVSNSSTAVNEDVMEALEPPPCLQMLEVFFYGGTRLPTWMTSLSNFRQLVLYACFELTSLPPFGILPSLEKLEFWTCPQLKFVGPAILGIRESLPLPRIGFPKLTKLQFVDCEEWEEWEDISPEEEDGNVSIMPRLCRLIIHYCPKLKALPCRLLHKASSLECINLDGKEYNPSAILSTAPTLAEIKAGKLGHQS